MNSLSPVTLHKLLSERPVTVSEQTHVSFLLSFLLGEEDSCYGLLKPRDPEAIENRIMGCYNARSGKRLLKISIN